MERKEIGLEGFRAVRFSASLKGLLGIWELRLACCGEMAESEGRAPMGLGLWGTQAKVFPVRFRVYT